MALGSPASGLARIVMLLLALGAGLAALAAFSSFDQADLIGRVLRGGAYSDAQLDASDDRQQIIGITQLALGIPSAVLFLIWVHRARRALDAAGVTGLRFTPGWAIGWFFVPIMNAFRPYQVMTEIYKASDPARTPDWKTRPGTALIAIWWTALLIASVLDRLILSSLRGQTPDQILRSVQITAWADTFGVVVAALAFVVVRSIDSRQRDLFAAERVPSTATGPVV